MGYTRKISKFEMIQFITRWHGNAHGTPSKLQKMKWSDLWEICDRINHEDDNNSSDKTMIDPTICPYCGSNETDHVRGDVVECKRCCDCWRIYHVEYDPDSLSDGGYKKVVRVTNPRGRE